MEALCLLNPGVTGQSEIRRDREAAVFQRDDVVNLKRQRVAILGDVAIFASCPSALPDELL